MLKLLQNKTFKGIIYMVITNLIFHTFFLYCFEEQIKRYSGGEYSLSGFVYSPIFLLFSITYGIIFTAKKQRTGIMCTIYFVFNCIYFFINNYKVDSYSIYFLGGLEWLIGAFLLTLIPFVGALITKAIQKSNNPESEQDKNNDSEKDINKKEIVYMVLSILLFNSFFGFFMWQDAKAISGWGMSPMALFYFPAILIFAFVYGIITYNIFKTMFVPHQVLFFSFFTSIIIFMLLGKGDKNFDSVWGFFIISGIITSISLISAAFTKFILKSKE